MRALLDEAERRVFAIAEQAQRGGGFTPLRVLLSSAVDRIETLFARNEPITGLPTGFNDLDEMTSGLQPADLIIVAGRPSMGKCLQADSEILLADGRLARIETLVQSRAARLLTLYPDGQLRFITPTAYVADGQKPMFRVTTALGRQIETTASHPFLTPAGWQPLAALRPVQAIAVPGALPVFGAAALPEATVIALAQAQAALDRDPARGAAAPWPDASLTLPRTSWRCFCTPCLPPRAREPPSPRSPMPRPAPPAGAACSTCCCALASWRACAARTPLRPEPGG